MQMRYLKKIYIISIRKLHFQAEGESRIYRYPHLQHRPGI